VVERALHCSQMLQALLTSNCSRFLRKWWRWSHQVIH
jgi:hypothetical protein